jgi:hypothetical protein
LEYDKSGVIYKQSFQGLEIVENSEIQLTIDLTQTRTLAGTVLTPTGAPASGVLIRVSAGLGDSSVRTSTSGTFSLQVPSGNASLSVIIDGLSSIPEYPQSIMWGSTINIEGNLNLELRLPSALAIPVTVTDTNKTPFPGTKISGVSLLNSPFSAELWPGSPLFTFSQSETSAITGLDGKATLWSFPGNIFRVDIDYVTNSATLSVKQNYVQISAETQLVFELNGLKTITGHVYSPAGVPVPGVFLQVTNGSQGLGETSSVYTDASGAFSMKIPSGFVALTITQGTSDRSSGLPKNFTWRANIVDAQSGNWEITLPLAKAITVNLKDATDKPVSGARVWISQAPLSEWVAGTAQLWVDGPTFEGFQETGDGFTDTAGSVTLWSYETTWNFLYVEYTIGGTLFRKTIAPFKVAGDMNLDLFFDNLGQVDSQGSAAGSLALIASPDVNIESFSSTVTADSMISNNLTDLSGTLSYRLTGLEPGSTHSVKIVLPTGTQVSELVKILGGVPTSVSTIAWISGNIVTLTITDGGLGDDDGVVNGEIVDPVVLLGVAPVTVPSTPQAPTGTAGNGQVTLFWSAPASNGSVIDSYTITQSTSASGPFTASSSSCTNINALTCTATGLTNGTSYYFAVSARNAIGISPQSPASNAVTPATVPSTPQAPTGTAGNSSITLTIAAPTSDGGSTITGFLVTQSTSTTGTFSPVTAGTCTTLTSAGTCTVTGLVNGTTYYFKVAAINAVGTGTDSDFSAGITPVAPSTAPSAPPAPTGIAGNGLVTLTISSPTSDGGSAITSYLITQSTSARRGFSPVAAGTCTTLTSAGTCTVTGLVNGTTYYFRVAAKNTIGTSNASSVSAGLTPVAPATVPGTPRSLSVKKANRGGLALSWRAPSSDGGSPILRYEYSYKLKIDSNYSAWISVSTSTSVTITIPPLVSGSTYDVRVRAVNAVGGGNPVVGSGTA